MATVEQFRFTELINYLKNILARRFAARVSRIYFGDIGKYPPSAFGASQGTQKAIIALDPVYNALIPNTRNAAFEEREYGLQIIVLMNLTPFFEANPEEAYAERELTDISEEIATFLTQDENLTLNGRIRSSQVGDINLKWLKRENQYLRAAAVSYTTRVKISRVQTTP